MRTILLILGIFAALAIIAGGFWQVSRGRTDRKRSHVELSRFLWMALGCALLVLTGFSVWVTSVGFSEIIPEQFDQSKNGIAAVISGTANHRGDYRASFLYNIRDGRAQRLPFALSLWTSTEFSGDEKTVAWVRRVSAPTKDSTELYIARLDSPNPEMTPTGIPLTGNFALSDDGSRAAISKFGGQITVYDLASRASLGSARVPDARWLDSRFVSNDLVRINAFGGGKGVRVYEYDVAKRILRQTGEAPVEHWRVSPDRTRAISYWKQPNHGL